MQSMAKTDYDPETLEFLADFLWHVEEDAKTGKLHPNGGQYRDMLFWHAMMAEVEPKKASNFPR